MIPIRVVTLAAALLVSLVAALALIGISEGGQQPNIQIQSLDCTGNPESVSIRNISDGPQDMSGWELRSHAPEFEQSFDLDTLGTLDPNEKITLYSNTLAPETDLGQGIYRLTTAPIYRDDENDDPDDYAAFLDGQGFQVDLLTCNGEAPVLTVTPPPTLPPFVEEDIFNVTAQVAVSSRLGQETIPLSGIFRIERSEPIIDEGTGVEVVAAEITLIDLRGDSVTGPITVSLNPDFISAGELRSLQAPPDQFPASSFFDIFVEAGLPVSGSRSSPTIHNEVALRLVPVQNGREVPLAEWPPVGVTFEAVPDACVPLLPLLPAEICVEYLSIEIGDGKTPTPTPTFCPPELCTPTPTAPPTFTPCPTAVCPHTPTAINTQPPATATPTSLPLPDDPTFSVAPGGPSGAHPADFLGLGTVFVSPAGNDDFANAFEIETFPFSGVQSTSGATTELGENLNPTGCVIFQPNEKRATVWFKFTAPASSTMIASTAGSNYDTVLAIYTGTTLQSLSAIGCDDDSGPGTRAEFALPVAQGTTYYLQAGGWNGATGNLILTVDFPGAAGADEGLPGFISCENLGLTADGCDDGSDGDQDDLDAISFGEDFGVGEWQLAFSVASGSSGLNGSGVRDQANCVPAQPQADEFVTNANGTNELFLDGDGLGGSCPTVNSLGLTELPTSDDLDALNGKPPSAVDILADGQLDDRVFISLAAGSPSLGALDRSPADILWTFGAAPRLYASAADLGLQFGDDIDAMCISDTGGGPAFDPDTDTILFSLTSGSPTLSDLNAGAADVLRPGPSVHLRAGQLGLRVTDDLNALECYRKADPQIETVAVGDIYFCGALYDGGVCDTTIRPGMTVQWDFGSAELPHTVTECGDTCDNATASPLFDSGVTSDGSSYEFTFDTPGTYLYYCAIHPQQQRGRIIVLSLGDTNCSGEINAIDAALVLQLIAGLVSTLSCQENADANDDGTTNSIDAALILQFSAGLLDQLPP